MFSERSRYIFFYFVQKEKKMYSVYCFVFFQICKLSRLVNKDACAGFFMTGGVKLQNEFLSKQQHET